MSINIKRMIIGAIAATVFSLVFAMVTCGGIFSWVYELEPTNVWKPMADTGPGPQFMIGSYLLTVVLAFVYAFINKGIPGKNRFIKGAIFGVIVWAVGMLPGMLATHSFMTVASTVVVYWTIVGFVELSVKGLIIAAIYGE